MGPAWKELISEGLRLLTQLSEQCGALVIMAQLSFSYCSTYSYTRQLAKAVTGTLKIILVDFGAVHMPSA